MTGVDEQLFFFEGSNERKLLGFLHQPINNCKETGIVYCHPFAEEKNCSHFVTARAAGEFARLGYPVLRFDFSGCGDSEGKGARVSREFAILIRSTLTRMSPGK